MGVAVGCGVLVGAGVAVGSGVAVTVAVGTGGVGVAWGAHATINSNDSSVSARIRGLILILALY